MAKRKFDGNLFDDFKIREGTEQSSQETAKNPVGRPKTVMVERRKVNIAVPVELLNEWNEIKQAKGNNFTEYVNKLIEADLSANKQKYLEIIQYMNS